ncbi:MAG: hypothetical protein Fur0025_05910 [Oscillatoriaceae cyanobacterium]
MELLLIVPFGITVLFMALPTETNKGSQTVSPVKPTHQQEKIAFVSKPASLLVSESGFNS